MATCSIVDCNKLAPSNRKGWCEAHYTRWRRHGNPVSGGTSKGEAERYFREVVLAYEGNECLIWPFARLPSGYAKLQDEYVHRLVCEEEHGPPPTSEHEAAHSCGKGHLACVAKRHLEWKTRKENAADKIEHGTAQRGENSGLSTLTEADIQAIRSSEEMGIVLAERFGVSNAHISNLRNGKRWGWLLAHQRS